MKVRRYGGFSNTKRKAYLERCRLALGVAEIPQAGGDEPRGNAADSETNEYSPACPRCGQPLTCLARSHRPSWRDTFSSSYRPPWYHDD